MEGRSGVGNEEKEEKNDKESLIIKKMQRKLVETSKRPGLFDCLSQLCWNEKVKVSFSFLCCCRCVYTATCVCVYPSTSIRIANVTKAFIHGRFNEPLAMPFRNIHALIIKRLFNNDSMPIRFNWHSRLVTCHLFTLSTVLVLSVGLTWIGACELLIDDRFGTISVYTRVDHSLTAWFNHIKISLSNSMSEHRHSRNGWRPSVVAIVCYEITNQFVWFVKTLLRRVCVYVCLCVCLCVCCMSWENHDKQTENDSSETVDGRGESMLNYCFGADELNRCRSIEEETMRKQKGTTSDHLGRIERESIPLLSIKINNRENCYCYRLAWKLFFFFFFFFPNFNSCLCFHHVFWAGTFQFLLSALIIDSKRVP